MKRLFLVTSLLASAHLGCKKKDPAPKQDPKVSTQDAGSPAGSAQPDAAQPAEPAAATTDSDVQPAMTNLADFKFEDGPPMLPKGFQISVVEGTLPFGDAKSFAILMKFPKGYVVPPHSHAVEERVTVLKGTLNIGNGDKLDKKATKPLKTGGVVALPGGQPHYAWVDEETIVHVHGVGPLGITYPDPKNDPRQPPPPPETKPATTTDTSMEPVVFNADEIKWAPAPPILPAGAQIGVVEGAVPFAEAKSYIFRLKFPDGYKIPPHIHNSTERVIVISGTLLMGSGDKWDDAALKEYKAGAAGHIPKAGSHFAKAKGETVVQIQGVGPFDLHYNDPKDDPSKAAPAGSAAGSAAAPATK